MFGAPPPVRAAASPTPAASGAPAASPGAGANYGPVGAGASPLPLPVGNAGDDPSKFAERAVPVLEAMQGLLNHLTAVKAKMDDAIKPRIYLDPTVAPVLKAITKKFPDLEAGMAPPLPLSTFSREVFETFEEPFRALARVIEVQEYALSLLVGALPLNIAPFEIPEIAELYLRLLSGYVKINLLVSKLDDRKLAVAAYSRVSPLLPRPNAGNDAILSRRIADYLNDFDSPIDGMQAKLEKVDRFGARVGELLGIVKPWLDAVVMPMSQLRQEGLLNIIYIPLDIKKPSSEDRRLRAMGRVSEVVDWVYYSCMVVPSEMVKPQALDALKSVFNFSFVHDLNHCDLFFSHPEFEGGASKAKAARSAAQEGALLAVQSAGLIHADRRDFARMTLWQILHLLRDKPGLVVPKLSLILANLGFARDEVLWYFRHVEQTPSNARKAKMNANDYVDYQLPELLYVIEQVRQHVLQYKKQIGQYYAQYLNGFYLARLREEANKVDQHLDDYLRSQLRGFIETLKLIDPFNLTSARLEGFRMNWKRTQVYLTQPGFRDRHDFAGFCRYMDDACARTRYIDSLDATLQASAGLQDLFHHRAQFTKALESCTKQVYQSRYIEAFISIVQQMPATVVPSFGRELNVIGPKVVAYMDEVLSLIARRIGECAQEWAQSWVGFCEQGSLDRVIVYVRQDRDAKDGRLVDKRGQPLPREPRPGAESNMRPDPSNLRTHGIKTILTNLCKAMGNNPIAVHDAVYSPSFYLLETLIGNARAWLTAALKPTEEQSGLIRRPSSLLTAVEAYIFSLQIFEGRSGVDIQTLLRDLLLDNVDLSKAKKLQIAAEQAEQAAQFTSAQQFGLGVGLGTVRRGTISRAKDKGQVLMPSVPAGDFGSILYIYGSWYAELASTRIVNGSAIEKEPYLNRLPPTYVAFSEARKVFISTKASYVKIEKYADYYELLRLAELLGSHGLLVIEDRLTKHVSKLVEDIRNLITLVRSPLESIVNNFTNATDSRMLVDPIKVFMGNRARGGCSPPSVEAALDRVVSIGVLFSFLDMVAEAVQTVTARRVPRLYQCIENAHLQLPANYGSIPKLLNLDNLANQVGIYRQVDASLQRVFRNTGTQDGDRRTWEMLPVLFAVFLTLVANSESSAYNMTFEIYDNNVGVLAKTFARLVNAALPPQVASAQKIADNPSTVEAHRKFVQIGSTLVMRMMKEAQRPPQLDTAVILLDKFVAQTKYVTFEMFNRILPYPIVRLAYAEMHRKFSRRKGLKAGPDESAFA